MTGLIKKQPVPFLMDTGSTHNFISAKWVKSLGLKSQSIKNFPVMIASNKQMVITRSCTQVEWRFGDHIFQADFLVLPSSIFGVILGMQWFKTLGDINWNCAQLTMQFQHQGKLVYLQGEQISENIMELEGKLKLAHC